MALTIASGFPFGLLVLLAIVGIGAVRLPYVMGWGHAARAAPIAPAPAPAVIPPPDARLEGPPAVPHPVAAEATPPEPVPAVRHPEPSSSPPASTPPPREAPPTALDPSI